MLGAVVDRLDTEGDTYELRDTAGYGQGQKPCSQRNVWSVRDPRHHGCSEPYAVENGTARLSRREPVAPDCGGRR